MKSNTFQSRSCWRKGLVVLVVNGPPLGRHEELVCSVVKAAVEGQLSQQLKVLGVQLKSKFTNILRAAFSYESVFCNFSLLKIWLYNFLAKDASKMLVKSTTEMQPSRIARKTNTCTFILKTRVYHNSTLWTSFETSTVEIFWGSQKSR